VILNPLNKKDCLLLLEAELPIPMRFLKTVICIHYFIHSSPILEKEVEHPNDLACLMGMGAPGFLGLDLSIPSGSKFHSLEVGMDCDIQLRLPTAENELRKKIFKNTEEV
jgi:hypothetical protein